MKIKLTVTAFILFLGMFIMTGCTINGFDQEEVNLIKSKGENEIMSLLTITNKQDSLFLRKHARKIDTWNINAPLVNYLKSRMLATVNDSLNKGVGIAAPQVGISLRMILVKRVDKDGEPFEAYYNPRILEYGDSVISGNEGCLSVPGFKGKVSRSQNIKIAYYDSLGEKKKEVIQGFTAVIFQHEFDHLNGILYFDHLENGYNSLFPSND